MTVALDAGAVPAASTTDTSLALVGRYVREGKSIGVSLLGAIQDRQVNGIQTRSIREVSTRQRYTQSSANDNLAPSEGAFEGMRQAA